MFHSQQQIIQIKISKDSRAYEQCYGQTDHAAKDRIQILIKHTEHSPGQVCQAIKQALTIQDD